MSRTPLGLVSTALASLGLEVRRLSAPDDGWSPPPIFDDLLDCLSVARAGVPAAFWCPLSEAVAYNGFRYGPGGWHPFVEALGSHAGGESGGFRGSSLEHFYRSWRPADAAEALIGVKRPGPSELRRLPSYAFLLPWVATTPAERLEAVRGIILSENRHHGNAELSVAAGYNQHGPVSPEKGAIEYRRLMACHRSIERQGWDRARGDATVTVLRRGSSVRYLILHGHHRAAAAAALGHTAIPARPGVPPEVRRGEAAHWPQVLRGVWPADTAARYLDHLFDFDSRRWALERGLARRE